MATAKAQSFSSFKITPTEFVAVYFPMKRRGSLLQSEMEFLEAREKDRLKVVLPMLRLAARISQEEGITPEAAIAKVQNLKGESDLGTMVKYLDEVDPIINNDFSEQEYRREIASLLINGRVAKKWLTENRDLVEEEFNLSLAPGMDFDTETITWLPEFTLKLPSLVVEAVCQFMVEERDGGRKEDPKPEKSSLGKSSKGSSDG